MSRKEELGTVPYEQMKLHSDNIDVIAGRMIIQNINWFPDERIEKYTRAGLIEIINRIYELGQEASAMYEDNYETSRLTLIELNIPWINTIERRNKYRLYNGWIYWGDKLIKEDFIFTFDQSGNIIFDGQENHYETVTVLPAEWRRVNYDYYRGGSQSAVTDIVRNELGVPDFELMEDEEGDVGEKVIINSIHIPNLRESIPGKVFVPSHTYDEEGDKSKDARVYSRALVEDEILGSAQFDQFRVEVTDKRQPFGYIVVEREVMDSNDNYVAITSFTNDTFDYSLKRRMINGYDDMQFLFCEHEAILRDFLYIFGKDTGLTYCENCDSYPYMPIGIFADTEKVFGTGFEEWWEKHGMDEDGMDDLDNDDDIDDDDILEDDDDFDDDDLNHIDGIEAYKKMSDSERAKLGLDLDGDIVGFPVKPLQHEEDNEDE